MSSFRKRMLIVDGYNVIRSGSRYKNIQLPDYTDDYFNVARERLLNDVIDFAGSDMDAIIVYDGGGNPDQSGKREQKVGHVKVVFSSSGQSADGVIEKLAFDARERGMEVLVVTSDGIIQDTVFGGGVDRMSAAGFCQEMATDFDGARQVLSPDPATKRTVQERIPQDVLSKLKSLRDSL